MSAPLLRRPAPAPYFHHFLIFQIPPSGEGSQYFAGAIFRSRFKKRGEGGLNARSKLALKTQKHRLYVPLETSEELKLCFLGDKDLTLMSIISLFQLLNADGKQQSICISEYHLCNNMYIFICSFKFVQISSSYLLCIKIKK